MKNRLHEHTPVNDTPKISYDPNNLTTLGTKIAEIDGDQFEIHNVTNFLIVWRFIYRYKQALEDGIRDPLGEFKSADNVRDSVYSSVVADNWGTLYPATTALSEEQPEMYQAMIQRAAAQDQVENLLDEIKARYGYQSPHVSRAKAEYRVSESEHQIEQLEYSQLLDKLIPITRRIDQDFDIDLYTK